MNKNMLKLAMATSLAATLAACETVTPVPGADRVKFTSVPVEVETCKPVGNVRPMGRDEAKMRNAVVGDGGDTLLITDRLAMSGVAYRCAKD